MAEEMGPQQPSLEQAVQKVGLLNMKLSELRAYAIEAGVPAAAMQAALEASGEQANALATLILQQQAVRAAPMPPPTAGVVEKDTPAPWAADSAALSMSGLRRRAAAAGVTPEQLDAACDDADPKQRVIEHIVARIEHFRSLKLSQLRNLAEGQPNARHPDAPWHGAGHSGDTTDDAIFSEKQPKEHAIALILNPVRNVDVAAPAKQLPANPENLSQIPSLRPQKRMPAASCARESKERTSATSAPAPTRRPRYGEGLQMALASRVRAREGLQILRELCARASGTRKQRQDRKRARQSIKMNIVVQKPVVWSVCVLSVCLCAVIIVVAPLACPDLGPDQLQERHPCRSRSPSDWRAFPPSLPPSVPERLASARVSSLAPVACALACQHVPPLRRPRRHRACDLCP